MRINKIYISAFGGLKDFTLELGSGLNVIYGNNEDGKSTVAAFIKAMFYGTGRNTKNLSESVRLKYTPWDNSTMAGRIFFEHGGKNYCLEREFRKSDSTDRITLTDLDSGKEISTGENVGPQFFGISAAAFERSLFIGNGDFIKDEAASSEINGKLSNIAITGTEDVSYKAITDTIFNARAKLISKSGRSGSYNEDTLLLEKLTARLEKADFDAKSKSQLNEKSLSLRDEYEALYKKYNQLKSVIDREQDVKNQEKLTEFLQTKQSLDKLNAELTLHDGTIINESFAQKVEFGLGKYEKHVERCNEISKDIDAINGAIKLQTSESPENIKTQIGSLTSEVTVLTDKKISYDKEESKLSAEINELKEKLTIAQNKKAKINPTFLISASIIAVSSGVAAFFSQWVISAVLIGITAVLLTLALIIKPKNSSAINTAQNELINANDKLSEIKAQRISIQEQINNINARINTLSSVLNADNAIKQQRLTDLASKNDLLIAEQQKAELAKSELISLVSGFGNINTIEQIKAKLLELKQKTEQQKEIKLKLKTASQYLGNIDYSQAEQKLSNLQNEGDQSIDFDAAKKEFEDITEKLSQLKDNLTAILTELKTSFKKSENPEELKREISQIKERLRSKKAFCDAADLSIEVLEESFYELRRGYGSELEKTTHSIFSGLTNGKYKNVNITDTLDLSVENSNVFGTRELGFLSLGATHQAYLSLRLAITKLISDDKLPIFLDDALSQYDDIRTENAIRFLKEFCADGQGILFTCHSYVCDIAKKHDIEIQKPYNAKKDRAF